MIKAGCFDLRFPLYNNRMGKQYILKKMPFAFLTADNLMQIWEPQGGDAGPILVNGKTLFQNLADDYKQRAIERKEREEEKLRKRQEKIRKLIEKGQKTDKIYKFLGECMPKIPNMYKMKSFKQK